MKFSSQDSLEQLEIFSLLEIVKETRRLAFELEYTTTDLRNEIAQVRSEILDLRSETVEFKNKIVEFRNEIVQQSYVSAIESTSVKSDFFQ